MPLISKGVYVFDDDREFERESVYYLSFQIVSALISLDYLNNYRDDPVWENKYTYYHYYTDHLLFSVGMIAKRFIITDKDSDIDLERKKANRQNYQFTEDKYPILSDRRARNTIEHMDEYNHKTITQKQGVGGFNVIDNTTPPELLDALYNRKDVHPYTLDLINRELLIRRNTIDLVIKLDSLKDELKSLHENVRSFADFLAFM